MLEHEQAPAPRRRGRAVGFAVFGVCVGGLTLIFATQILIQVFSDPPDASASCDTALEDLWEGLQRARQSAMTETGERAKLDAFRRGLMPEWRSRSAAGQACSDDPQLAGLHRDLVRLRYLEEGRVRTAAGELTALRTRAAASMAQIRQQHPSERQEPAPKRAD